MSTDLQCQQAAHELLRMIEHRFRLSTNPEGPDVPVTLEGDDIDRLSLMMARLDRLTGRLDPSDVRSEMRHRHAALEKYLAIMRTQSNTARQRPLQGAAGDVRPLGFAAPSEP